jgi:hypothetical protein
MRLRNRLWNPDHPDKIPKQAKGLPKDELCKHCINIKVCKGSCPVLSFIDGRSETRELILNNPEQIEQYSNKDYKEVINGLMERRAENHIDAIRDIQDLNIRAMACMIWADISINQISKIIKIHRSSCYKKIASFIKDINGV